MARRPSPAATPACSATIRRSRPVSCPWCEGSKRWPLTLAVKSEGYPVSTAADTDREEGLGFAPKFDASGLVTCVATDATSGEVLMVAHMNDEALRKTVATGEAWYYSRSRKA